VWQVREGELLLGIGDGLTTGGITVESRMMSLFQGGGQSSCRYFDRLCGKGNSVWSRRRSFNRTSPAHMPLRRDRTLLARSR
jgi:hypothetical protein